MRNINLIIVYFLLIASVFGDDGSVEDEVPENDAELPEREEYVAPTFTRPSIIKQDTYFVEWFDDLKGINQIWFKSVARKEGAEEALAKYNGEWTIGVPSKVVIEDDYGLIVKTKARHHAIAANLNRPFKFDGATFVAQFEVKYEQGQECGGGYAKFLTADDSLKMKDFYDKTPYTIMFGPDKCGMSSKVHFIIRHQNPKNGTISEHHAKQPSKSASSYFDDQKTHLYTLIIQPDNSYSVLVDHEEIMSGSLLKDVDPPVTPPKQISDPDDKKPADWDDNEFIVDSSATKPNDWDENAPKEIVDEDVVKPSDWLDDEESFIADPDATKPNDWDDEMDGEWEPKKIENPKCTGHSGCGKWVRPMKANPEYKGKWSPPKISNPNYKGRWAPRLIDNPHYFETNPYEELSSIGAIGFELWTMSSDIIFDNILVADDVQLAREFARQTFDVKVAQEKLFDQINNPQKSLWASLLESTEEKPWIWVLFILALLIPIIVISVYCFGKKSTPIPSSAKKTDEPQPDDEYNESDEENINLLQQGSGPNDENVETEEATSASLNNTSANDAKQKEETAQNTEEESSPAAPVRRTRVRRQD